MAGTPGRKPSPFTPIINALRQQLDDDDIPDIGLRGGADGEKSRLYWSEREETWNGFALDRERAGNTGWDSELFVDLAHALSRETNEEAIAALYTLAGTTLRAIASLERQR
jgi:hypothetical protein